MRTSAGKLALVIGALCGLLLSASAQEVVLNGPESKDVVPQVSGYVVRTRNRTEIVAQSLPALKETAVCRLKSQHTIHAVSGPDLLGRIAYLEDQASLQEKSKQHWLKTIQIDGSGEAEVFARPGRDELGTHLALSPCGGKAALLAGLSDRPMPGKTLHAGTLEIWDIENGERLAASTQALDQPLSWFPDGKRVAYTRLVSREELSDDALGLREFGDYLGNLWNALPAIYALDIDTGQSTFLHVGWTPIVSHDGCDILVGGWDRRGEFSWNRLELEGNRSAPVEWPGNVGGAIAEPAENIVLYTGLPTVSKRKAGLRAVRGSRPALTLKLAILNGDDFQTLVSPFDDRDFVSFGRVSDRD